MWARPLASSPGGTMPIDWPSSTGNGTAPKSSTMWGVWLAKPSSVQSTLPTTVAVAVLFGVNRLVTGFSADHGGTVEPKAAELNGASPAAAAGSTASTGSLASAAVASADTPS